MSTLLHVWPGYLKIMQFSVNYTVTITRSLATALHRTYHLARINIFFHERRI
jgi:hypothetical protein